MNRVNRARGTQAPVKGAGSSRPTVRPVAATKGSKIPAGNAQQRDRNVWQTYQRGNNPSSTPASRATVKPGSRRQNRG